jgi:GAF domain-containing protein
MNELPAVMEAFNTPYLRNDGLVKEILRNISMGNYCTILGPRFSRKSALLQDLKGEIQKDRRRICVYIDLRQIDFTSNDDFLKGFAAKLDQELGEETEVNPLCALETVIDLNSLQNFIEGYIKVLDRVLVLMIDHLERKNEVPIPIASLLNVLRNLYTRMDKDEQHGLVVVISSSLSVADLSLGKGSPFNIAKPFYIENLSVEQSKKLISTFEAESGYKFFRKALNYFLSMTNGDINLMQVLWNHCVVSTQKIDKIIDIRNVRATIHWFLNEEANQYLPLQDAAEGIERDPDTLLNILKILELESVRKNELYLRPTMDPDALFFTGMVRIDKRGEEQYYSIKNKIYQSYLKGRFHLNKVFNILSREGPLDNAFNYFEQIISSQKINRGVLLEYLISLISVSRDIHKDINHLARSICAIFNVSRACIYLINSEKSQLILQSQSGYKKDELLECISLENQNTLEAQNWRINEPGIVKSDKGNTFLYIPLVWTGNGPIGIAILPDYKISQHSNDYFELITFFRQLSRVILLLLDRELRLFQFNKLSESGKNVTNSLDLKQVMKTTVQAAIEAVPSAQRGSVFEWDDQIERLVISHQVGFSDEIISLMRLKIGQGYAGEVYQTRQPKKLDEVFADPGTYKVETHPEIMSSKSALCVPLIVWEKVIGVLCVDNKSSYYAFDHNDLKLLEAFGTQAAIAIQNARLSTELYQLGIDINSGTLTPKEIFDNTVKSITFLTNAKAATILLLRDTDEPDLCISQPPILIMSNELGNDFDKNVRPRTNGFTFKALTTKQPIYSSTGQNPDINPLLKEKGIKASLCLPLRVHRNIIGVLFVHYLEPHNFSENEIRTLSLFANQAALAIDNARQREELAMTKAVAWMGIVQSSMAHRMKMTGAGVTLKTFRLRHELEKNHPELMKYLDEIDRDMRNIIDTSSRSLVPYKDEKKQFNIIDLIQNEVAKIGLREKNVKFNISLPDQIILVEADPQWIKEVVELITDNAVKAIKAIKEPADKSVSIDCQRRGHRVVFEFRNVGEPISEAVKHQLFKEPIPKNEGHEGSGVGLLIARTIIRRYGGDLELVKSDQKDTTFSMWLPILL